VIIYKVSQFITRMIAHVLWGLRVEGLERVPRRGAFIVAASHESFLDPPLVGAIGPTMWFMARKTIYVRPDGSRRRILSFFGRAFNNVEIDLDTSGRDGLRVALELLAADRGFVLFPEGTRSPDGSVREFLPGVGMLALKTGAPVIPCSVEGTHRVWGRGQKRPRILGGRRGGPIKIIFGEPISYSKPGPFEAGPQPPPGRPVGVGIGPRRQSLTVRGGRKNLIRDTPVPAPPDGGSPA